MFLDYCSFNESNSLIEMYNNLLDKFKRTILQTQFCDHLTRA